LQMVDSWQLFVKTLTGRTVTINVYPLELIHSLMRKIQEQEGKETSADEF